MNNIDELIEDLFNIAQRRADYEQEKPENYIEWDAAQALTELTKPVDDAKVQSILSGCADANVDWDDVADLIERLVRELITEKRKVSGWRQEHMKQQAEIERLKDEVRHADECLVRTRKQRDQLQEKLVDYEEVSVIVDRMRTPGWLGHDPALADLIERLARKARDTQVQEGVAEVLSQKCKEQQAEIERLKEMQRILREGNAGLIEQRDQLQAKVDRLTSRGIEDLRDQNAQLQAAIVRYMRWENHAEQGESKDGLVECFLDEWDEVDVQTMKTTKPEGG